MASHPKRRKEDHPVEQWGWLIRIAAIIATVVLFWIDTQSDESVPVLVYGGMLGVAIAAKPDDVREIIRRR